MSQVTLGTCSLCGGRVTVPDAWHGIHPPVPTCQSCGARKRRPYGPVVDMEPAAPNDDVLAEARRQSPDWTVRNRSLRLLRQNFHFRNPVMAQACRSLRGDHG